MVFNTPEYRRLEARARLRFNDAVRQLTAHDWRQPMQPWGDFFSPSRFSLPKLEAARVQERLSINLPQYQSNYVAVCGAIAAFHFLRNPMALCVVGGAAAVYKYGVAPPRALVVNGTRISQTDKYRGFYMLLAVVLVVSGVGSNLFQLAGLCSGAVLGHATCRKTTATQKIFNKAKNAR